MTKDTKTKASLFEEHYISIQGIDIDRRRLNDRKYIVNKAFQIIANPDRPWDLPSTEFRLHLVRSLENIISSEFKNTKEFKRKINDILMDCDFRKKEINLRIINARKKLKITQKQLADQLGYKSHVTIVHFEDGSRYPSKIILQWLEKIGM